MKKKIIGLKIMTFVLTYIIAILEVLMVIYLTKYFVNNSHLIIGIFIVGIAIIIAALFYSSDLTKNYEKFEEQEVKKWEYLTGKRIIKLIFKYHLSVMSDILYVWDWDW